VASYPLSALPLVEFAHDSALTLSATKRMVSSVLVAFAAQAALTWAHTMPARASALVEFAGSANLHHGRHHAMKAHGEVEFTGIFRTCTLTFGMTVRDAVRSIVSMWGQASVAADSPETGEAVTFLNAAMQRLHESGKDYGFVSRVRRFYSGYYPVSSIPLESDVQHVDGNVVFLPFMGRWNMVLTHGASGGDVGGSIVAADLSTTAIAASGNIKTAFETATGMRCQWTGPISTLSILVPGGEESDYPPLRNTAGVALSQLLNIDSGWGLEIIGLVHPTVAYSGFTSGITWTEPLRTPLRPLDGSASVDAVRARFRSSKFSGLNLRRPLAYAVKSSPSRTSVKGMFNETVQDAQHSSRAPTLEIQLAPAAEYTSGTGPLGGTVQDIWELQADVFLEPPRFSCCDVASGTRLPVPHRYAESLVIPLARYYALSARYRVQESTVAFVKEQAAQALALIGEVDPRAKEVQENRKPSK